MLSSNLHLTVALIGGLVLHYYIDRRRFNRRNAHGVETFSSYDKFLSTRLLEKLGKLLANILLVWAVLGYLLR